MRTHSFLLFVMAAFTLCSCGASRSTVYNSSAEDYVSNGYSQIRKDASSYAQSRVVPDDKSISSYSSIEDYLVGRVAGLEMAPEGFIVIRGARNFEGYIEPLYIVDGVEVVDLSFLNPNDVYSVDVLKDSSASIYGMRGAGGAIIITTKGSHDANVSEAQARKALKEAEKQARRDAREKEKEERKSRKGDVRVEVNVNTGVAL